MDLVCQELIDLAALRLEPGECVAGWWDEESGAYLDKHLYRLEKRDQVEVEAHRHLGQAEKVGLHCFVVCFDGAQWTVLGSSVWSKREQRPIPSSGTGAHGWHENAPLYRGRPGLTPLHAVRVVPTLRLRPSWLAARLAS